MKLLIRFLDVSFLDFNYKLRLIINMNISDGRIYVPYICTYTIYFLNIQMYLYKHVIHRRYY